MAEWEEAFSDGICPNGRYYVDAGGLNEHQHFIDFECLICRGEPMTETEEALKLSIIAVQLLKDLDDLGPIEGFNHHQAIQLISDAFDAAYEVKYEAAQEDNRDE